MAAVEKHWLQVWILMDMQVVEKTSVVVAVAGAVVAEVVAAVAVAGAVVAVAVVAVAAPAQRSAAVRRGLTPVAEVGYLGQPGLRSQHPGFPARDRFDPGLPEVAPPSAP